MKWQAMFFFTLAGFLPIVLPAQRQMLKVSTVSRPEVNTKNIHYVSNRAPLAPSHLIKLPINSIKPSGWIRKCLELQRKGLTGHLGEISAWLDKNKNAWYSGTGIGDHGWEEVPYWLKGYGDLGYILRDSAIITETKSWLEKVFKSQRPDGYFGPSIIDAEHPKHAPDIWPNMLMLFCMQSYYDFSHDTRVLDFMKNYFRWENAVPDSNLLKSQMKQLLVFTMTWG